MTTTLCSNPSVFMRNSPECSGSALQGICRARWVRNGSLHAFAHDIHRRSHSWRITTTISRVTRAVDRATRAAASAARAAAAGARVAAARTDSRDDKMTGAGFYSRCRLILNNSHGADMTPIATTALPDFDEIPIPRSMKGLWLEARVGADLVRGLLHLPHTLRAPRGRRAPVLLLPGFAASDRSMVAMRLFLRRLGWRARGWGLGVNRGNAPALLPRVIEVAERWAQRIGAPLRLVGWSMGGFL